jgi:sterol desaturase/sphingolipid hydroxylase (fatty acid hydroxylase superfamily)
LSDLLATTFQQFGQDDLIYFALPVFLLATVLEFYFDQSRGRGWYLKGDTQASLWMMVITAFVDILPKFGFLLVMVYLHEISPLRDVVARQPWAWALLFVLDDFTYYWFHRMNHQVRLLWAGHVPHHSAVRVNFATALRQGVGERAHKYLFWLPLALLGFDPLMILSMITINLFYQFWLHTEAIGRLPPFYEFIFNTPSHHRVHHASNVRYLDCNHGGVLIIWDRLFGSFSQETVEDRPVYGLTKNIESNRPVYVASHEYASIWRDIRRAENWRDRLRYLIRAPGWSHDGPDMRSETLRENLSKGIIHGQTFE